MSTNNNSELSILLAAKQCSRSTFRNTRTGLLTSVMLPGVAVLLLSAAPLSAQAGAGYSVTLPAAGPNRPAQVPEDYVATPFGYAHQSCVLQLAKDEILLPEGRVKHADGSVDANPIFCSYPRFTSKGEVVTPQAAQADAKVAPAAINGWIESSSLTTSQSYGKIVSSWSVPPQPAANDGQTIFLFPGFEDDTNVQSILQPVMQWYAPGPWQIAAWNCCLNGIVTESTPTRVWKDDLIVGTITSNCPAGSLTCSTWNVTIADHHTAESTSLNSTPSDGQQWNWAFAGTLEGYGIAQCSDLPGHNSITLNVTLYDQNLKPITKPAWSNWTFDPTGAPQCNYGVSVNGNQITLRY